MKIFGLGVPELMIILALIVGIACAIACSQIATKKGYSGAMFGVLGFFFGLIPLIIVLVLQDKGVASAQVADGVLKYKQLLDQGLITQEEFDQKKNELLGLK